MGVTEAPILRTSQRAAQSTSHMLLGCQVVRYPNHSLGVAGAVLQSPPSIINYLTDYLVQNLQDTVNPKLLELGS